VTGLGYVGLTTAIAFSHIDHVIALDSSQKRIDALKKGHDDNEEVSDEELKNPNLLFTTNPAELKIADFHIITVPTPLDNTNHPDFTMLKHATETVANQLKKDDIVVYESTVYPGATEEMCIPILEKTSGLVCGKDFTVGYSPERVNPADKEHVFDNIVKVVSGTDAKTLEIVSETYRSVVKAGVFPVSSIRIAEATKVIENTQRDINIAYMNDIAIMLHSFGMEMTEVIAAMKTKWNYVPFTPGLVGGHCIGNNSYYLMHKAEEVGYYSEIISAGRRVNDNIVKFIVDETIRQLIHKGFKVKGARVAVLGLTYKENCSDLRDTRVIDIIHELKTYDIEVIIHDPIAHYDIAFNEYGIKLASLDELKNIDAIIFTVVHKQYLNLDKHSILKMLNKNGLIMDIKEIFDSNEFYDTGITIWRL
jgi:UDP-N-acetyl-D-galactosamine dehydrogenase